MKKLIKSLAVMLISVLMVVTITGCSSTTLTSSNSTTGETKTSYALGETFQNDYIKVTFVSSDSNFTNYSKYATVTDGYKIVSAKFEFENVGTTDHTVAYWDFNCYADGYDCNDFYSVDDSAFSSSLSSGKKATGTVYFEVPENAQSIVVEYDTSIWNSENIEFVIQ